MAVITSRGTISHMSEVTTGKTRSGEDWYRQTIILDIAGHQGSISKLVLNVDTKHYEEVSKFGVGDKVEAGWVIYAREWKERWFNNVDLVSIKAQEERTAKASAPAPEQTDNESLEPQADDLPF